MNALSAFQLSCFGLNDVVKVECGDYPEAEEINLRSCGWTPIELSSNRHGIAAKVRYTDFQTLEFLEEELGRPATEEEKVKEMVVRETVVILNQRYSDSSDLWVAAVGNASAVFEFHKSGGLMEGLEDKALAFFALLKKQRSFVPARPRYNRDGVIAWDVDFVELIED